LGDDWSLHAFLREYQMQKVKFGRERDASGQNAHLCP
jgi:hypothetical protein